ncbi:MAG TPA: sigma 54-interacting transcriptional regulator [Desulfomonilaceae bacterium]|nr:sigma 54-interacting transcriptional regulator [Desulfomonilaceae bacterium]
MKKKNSTLRDRAEKALAKLNAEDVSELPIHDLRKLLHELRVHQVELELQNEELRTAQIAIEEARDTYVNLYDYAPVAYFTLNHAGIVTNANLTAVRLMGIEKKLLLNKTFPSLVLGVYQSRCFTDLCRVARTESESISEVVLLKKNGDEVHVQLHMVFQKEIQGTGSIWVSATDMTRRVELEDELRASHEDLERTVKGRTWELSLALEDLTREADQRRRAEETLELAIQGGDLGLWEWNAATKKARMSCRGAEILGYSTNVPEVTFEAWMQRIHPDDRDAVTNARQNYLDSKAPFLELEYRFERESGGWLWILTRGKVVEWDDEGQPVRIVGTFLDITSRKKAEQALHEAEGRFRAVFEAADNYIFVKDASLRYTDVNPAAERLLGLPASKIIGLTSRDLFDSDDAERIEEVDKRVLNGQSIEQEHTLKIRGVPIVFLESSVPLRHDSGLISGIFTISRDITERKLAEDLPEMEDHCHSRSMRTTLSRAKVAASRATTILLTGESGSGKDYLARYIHNLSNRANGPYFSVNCAAIAPELAESELFGHERGSFTGAAGRKRGLLELAEGGTLLLNEIGELPLPLQAKLLSFLDTRTFTRVGGEKQISVDARLITATNRDLAKEVDEGRFRKDLFYRVNVMSIEVPPLRERREDIPLLVRDLLTQLCRELQIPMPGIETQTMELLTRYDWPGNVRELRNVLERSLILSRGEKLNPAMLAFRSNICGEEEPAKTIFSTSFPNDRSLNEITRELKKFFIDEALRVSAGSRQMAAKMLGISRYSLKHYMKALGYFEEE